jgi:hypothetical protein
VKRSNHPHSIFPTDYKKLGGVRTLPVRDLSVVPPPHPVLLFLRGRCIEMHVLLVTKLSLASSRGGAEIIVQTLCEGLVGKGHRVTFLSFDPNGESVRHGNAAVTLVNYAPRIYRLIRHTRFNMAIEALGADPTDRSLQIFKKLVDQETFDVQYAPTTRDKSWHMASGSGAQVADRAYDTRLPLALPARLYVSRRQEMSDAMCVLPHLEQEEKDFCS